MRPRVAQLAIIPDLEQPGPVDYSKVALNPLNRQTWDAVKTRLSDGASSTEIAKQLKRPAKSIAGRFTELHAVGLLRSTEAYRHGRVYIAVGEWPS